jgi:MFS family permease
MTAVVSASEDKSTPTGRSMLEVWIITVGHALTHWYPSTFYILLPLIGVELGLSYGQIGMILTAQYAAGAISNLPGGILVDSMSRKGVLMAASLFWIGVPYFLMGFSDAYWVLLTCSALIGVGNNLWHPTAIPWLGRRYPERKGLVMAYHGMGGNVGDALAPLAAGALLTASALLARAACCGKRRAFNGKIAGPRVGSRCAACVIRSAASPATCTVDPARGCGRWV